VSDPLKLGLIVHVDEDLSASFQRLADLGVETCQLMSSDPALLTEARADEARAQSERTGIEVNTLWAGHSGAVWDFVDGPTTIGLVPPATRAERIEELREAAHFAERAGAPSITTHAGFIPENLTDLEYPGVRDAIGEVARHCEHHGLGFWLETGQETPVVLLRLIEDIGLPSLGVNLDPANLILYGKANPVDALDLIGPHVRGVHAKDGRYPTNGRELGQETPLDQGLVDFPALIGKLKALGFDGSVTIENEMGAQTDDDLRAAIAFVRALL
jgi:L-ribulose-5-phosphate 3-epimerase